MSEWREETWAIRTQMKPTHQAEHSVPVYLTSSYTFDDAETMRAAFADEVRHQIYGRYTNPNVDELVEKVRHMEGAESGHAMATGMAALFGTIGGLLQVGDHIVAGRAIFGTTHTLLTKWLPRFGIAHTLVDLSGGVDAFADAITPATKLMLVETPTNPGVEIVDLEALAGLARERKLVMVVDNTFATPVLQKPVAHGADLVFHSATKFMDGQGRVLGGVVVGPERLIADIRLFCRTTGPSLGAFDAWVISKGIETLPLRMERHAADALALAQRLEASPEVESVRYPFLPSHPAHALARKQMKAGGAIVTFAVKGGLERGRRFLDALEMCTLTPNLGDARTIATHPASTTHSKLTDEERAAVGIGPGLVRVSVGLEHVEDIIADVEQALGRSR